MTETKQSKKRNKPTLSHALAVAVIQAGEAIRKAHQQELSDRIVVDLAARRFRSMIAPRRRSGRPRTESVKIGLEMRSQGKTWREVYKAVWPRYWAMDKYERQIVCTNLRRAVRMARKRSKGEQIPETIVPPTNPN